MTGPTAQMNLPGAAGVKKNEVVMRLVWRGHLLGEASRRVQREEEHGERDYRRRSSSRLAHGTSE
jgi:hypothetical protein